MKTNRRFFLLAGLATMASGPAWAQQESIIDNVLAQIRQQGFEIIEVRRTLLGRIRVLARRGNQTREVVFDPRNGVILRDFTRGSAGSDDDGDGGGTSGPGSGERGDDDDDDDDDDDGGGDDGGGDDDGDDD